MSSHISIVPAVEPSEGHGGPIVPEENAWWNQYKAEIRRGLPERAISEIDRVSSSILCSLSPVLSGEKARVKGALVGSVQSGKTGALGAVIAKALDSGFRIVIVLSGLKDDLRTQTARRLYRTVLSRGDRVYRRDGRHWVATEPPAYDHPLGSGYHGSKRDCWAPHYKDDANHDQSFRITLYHRLRRGKSVLAVVKKNTASLEAVHEGLRLATATLDPSCLPLLVIDDECDEASTTTGAERATSSSIRRLLLDCEEQPAAYVGVTATIAATLLQETHDVLFPEDFIEVLRPPSHRETAVGYYEPSPHQRHSGGFVYYEMLERFGFDNFILQPTVSDEEQSGSSHDRPALAEALIAYFVSGAIRLCWEPGASLTNPAELPAPHCMIVHTDEEVSSHRKLCRQLVKLVAARSEQPPRNHPDALLQTPGNRLSPELLNQWLAVRQGAWRRWYEGFRRSHQIVESALPGRASLAFPSWEEVSDQLPRIFDAVKLRVINSDDTGDSPLDYSRPVANGVATAPVDLYSIIIGGNRLSRGLTIEGLCVSYYTRSSRRWAEDTTTQRERWFGYRGRFIELCRVFVHADTALRLTRFHEHEVDLRGQLALMIQQGRTPTDTALRLMCLPDSVPTSRSSRGVRHRLNVSGSRVFVDVVQMGDEVVERAFAFENDAHVRRWWRRIRDTGERLHSRDGAVLGWVRRGVRFEDSAELLDGIRYTFHNPHQNQGIAPVLRRFFREPDHRIPARSTLSWANCPYAVAAYLRYWSHAYEASQRGGGRDLRGSDGLTRWVPVPAPPFNVAFRFGRLPCTPGDSFSGALLLDRTVLPDGRVASRWGGHGASGHIHGDEWIDLPPPAGDPSSPRQAGQPGLILIHVVHRDATGRGGHGTSYRFHRPFFGICIPSGGPSFECVVAGNDHESTR